jgi:hypothetical protein
LIDGTLVEKDRGVVDAFVAENVADAVARFVAGRQRGVVVGAACPFRLAPRLVCIPDVAFVSWDRLPGKVVPKTLSPTSPRTWLARC